MKSKRLQVKNLEHSLHELAHLGDVDIYVNVEDVVRLNREIRFGIEALYPVEAVDDEEEASICILLLQAYGNLMWQDDKDELRRQSILDRSSNLLSTFPVSLRRCALLVYCYGEVYRPELASEAHAIMDSWRGRELSEEEQELVETLQILEDCE